jgi:hypothetical protein
MKLFLMGYSFLRHLFNSIIISTVFFGSIHTLTAQNLPDEVHAISIDNTSHICEFEPTDIDAHFFIKRSESLLEFRKEAASAQFQVTYVNACGSNNWPAQAITAFESAADIWSAHLQSTVPIRIEASWVNIQSDGEGVVLGSAGPTQIIHSSSVPGSRMNTWYSIAQASAISNIDFVNLISGEDYDITVRMNCDFPDWYFGTDANPGSGLIDFLTVVLHEIGHGIGFFGSMRASTSQQVAEWGFMFNPLNQVHPIIYDRFTEDGNQSQLINQNVYPNPSGVLYNAVTGNQGGVFFSGNNSDGIFGGEPVPLFAPDPWQPGSSFSHYDNDTFRNTDNALMRPRIDRASAIHDPGQLFCALLADTGWPIGSACEAKLSADADIIVAANELDFGLNAIGSSTTLAFEIMNDPASADRLSGRVVTEGEGFSLVEADDIFSLAPGESAIFNIRFSPNRTGRFNGRVQVFHNSDGQQSPIQVSLIGDARREGITAVLDQNYPNPFNNGTTISYVVSEQSDVVIDLYSINGRFVKRLEEANQAPGRYDVQVQLNGLASGVYLYRIIANNYYDTKKMILVK